VRLRFRIRTLMLAVAGVALVCTAIVELPGREYLLILLVPAIGPLIGADWAGRRNEPDSLDPISGGLVGGTVQAILMAMALSAFSPLQPPFVVLPLLAIELVYGLLVGSIVTYGLLTFSSEPASSRSIRREKRVGTRLQDPEPARAVDELEAWSALFHEAGADERDRLSDA
jgi:hypothetical protein